MDWTNSFKQKTINEFSNDVLNLLLDNIAKLDLKEFKHVGILKDEIKLLYRWSLYVSINSFTDRFLRTINNVSKSTKNENISNRFFNITYTSILDATLNYYNNEKLNINLLNNLNLLIHNNDNYEKNNINIDFFYREVKSFNKNLKEILKLTKFYIKFYLYKYTVLIFSKPNHIYEGNSHLKLIFSKKNSFINYPFFNNYIFSKEYRFKIREIAENLFIQKYSKFLKNLGEEKIIKLSKLFSFWIESSIPFSLLEGLKERFNFYNKFLKFFNIKTFHASVGFFTNENIKIFSILAKRKKILIIGHEHGVNNFITAGKDVNISHYKGLDHLLFSDIFLSWGKDQISDKWNNTKHFGVKVIESGSVYINYIQNLKKENFSKINSIKEENSLSFVIFYCASQFRNYMSNLEEISPEKNYSHKENVALFLKKIMDQNNNIKLIYKPFPENIKNQNDLFYKIFSNEIKINKAIATDENAVKVMFSADIVIFDLISTGFAEAINIGKPSFVYTNPFEYMRASIEGKKINKKLYNAGIFFDNQKKGIEIVEKVLKDKNKFQKETKDVLNIFKHKLCYPVQKKEFLKKLENIY